MAWRLTDNGVMERMVEEDGKLHVQRAMGGLTNLFDQNKACLLYTSPSPRDGLLSRMPSSA